MSETRIPSPTEIEARRTPAGVWTKAQLAQWGVPWPPSKGWRQKLVREWKEQQAYTPELSEFRKPMPVPVCFVKFLWAVSAFLLVRLSGCF